MVSDGKGFDSLFKCLCSNNDATITDLSEHCTTEKGKKGQLIKLYERLTYWHRNCMEW